MIHPRTAQDLQMLQRKSRLDNSYIDASIYGQEIFRQWARERRSSHPGNAGSSPVASTKSLIRAAQRPQ